MPLKPSVYQMGKQVVIASSVTPKDVNDATLSQVTTYDIPDVVQPTDRKEGDNSKVIIIPAETASYITGKNTRRVRHHQIRRRIRGFFDL